MSDANLLAEIADMRIRLQEAEETIRAIRSGSVDAFLVEEAHGARVYTLQSADRPYRLLVEEMQQGALTLSSEGTIAYCNRRFADLVGKPHVRLMGIAFRDFIPLDDHIFYESLLQLGRAGLSQGESHLRNADGVLVPVFLTFNALPPDCGAAIGVLVTDLTTQRHHEKLRESEAFSRGILENSPDCIKVLDGVGRVVGMNANGKCLMEIDDFATVENRLWWELWPAEGHVQVLAAIEAARTGGTGRFSLFCPTAKGTPKWWDVIVAPIRDAEGEVVRFVSVSRDITERKLDELKFQEQAAALAEADRRKNEFLAMLAHELRNPLAPIRNAAQVLQHAPDSGDAVRSAAAMIGRQVSQMVRLVDDLLDVSRINQGKIELRRERIELASAVNQAVETARSLYKGMNHELTVALPSQPIYLNADPTRLAQVVGNLLNNACKFTDKGGCISLAVERDGDRAVIRVQDSGIGIDAAQLPRIFDMFVQIDTSLERSTSGLGIGLTLVKNLVEMHEGTVEVQSAGAGLGSEFVVRLPIMVEVVPRPLEPAVRTPSGTAARRILVVDDNRDSAESLAELLELTGNKTHVAYDGLEAVAAAATFEPAVVLLDIGLPRMNGYEAAQKIREQPWGKKMVLIALTGWGQDDARQRSREAGFDGHLVKPVDYADLMKLLTELLAIRA